MTVSSFCVCFGHHGADCLYRAGGIASSTARRRGAIGRRGAKDTNAGKFFFLSRAASVDFFSFRSAGAVTMRLARLPYVPCAVCRHPPETELMFVPSRRYFFFIPIRRLKKEVAGVQRSYTVSRTYTTWHMYTVSLFSQVKKYDSKAAVAGTPKAYSTGEDMVQIKVVRAGVPWCVLCP